MFGRIVVEKELIPVNRRKYAYACELESLYRCANAPTHTTIYSILSNVSFFVHNYALLLIVNSYYKCKVTMRSLQMFGVKYK